MNQQMNEVGVKPVDNPQENSKMNGGINGGCENEPMEVIDAEDISLSPSESVKKNVDDESVSASSDNISEAKDNIQIEDKSNKNSEQNMEIDIDNYSPSQENGSVEVEKAHDNIDEEIDFNKSSDSDLIVNEPTENRIEKDDDKSIENDVANKDDTKRSTSTENGTVFSEIVDDSDDLLRPMTQTEVDDVVHAISDSDDDENDDVQEIEPKYMEASNISDNATESNNKSKSANGVNKIILKDGNDYENNNDDDDKPVSIHSDSDSEPEANKDEVHEILSDKEDCVVIEDDKKLDENDLLIRPVNRARKSAVRSRDFSTFDDDIEEIIEDPLEQTSSKKPRLNDTLTSINESQNSSNNEPALVIIDTNTILSRSSTSNVPSANENISIDSRVSITTVPNNNQTALANVTSTTLAGLNAPVLTALTDDMFVLEAPSFIVPYIYEKPPSTELRDFVTKIGIEIEERRKIEELEKKKREAEKEKQKEMDKDDDKDSNDDEDDDAAKETDKSGDQIEKKTKKRKTNKNADESWDESDVSTDDDSDIEETKVLIKEAKDDLSTIQTHIIDRNSINDPTFDAKKDNNNYFDSPLGKFFMDIGINLVQEYVQTDLLRTQKRRLNREGNQDDVKQAINSLMKNLEESKGKNDPFKFQTKQCEYCNFKSESSLVMAYHYETPHMKGNVYKCNFCEFEVKPPFEILLHMKDVHNIKGRLDKPSCYHQCPNCMFEDNGKSKLARHTISCSKRLRPEMNLAPPVDWDPPAKIPRMKPRHGLVGTANAYQAMAAQAQRAASAAAIQRQNAANVAAMKNRGRPQSISKIMPTTNNNMRPQQQAIRAQVAGGIVLPNNFQVTNPGQFIQAASSKSQRNSQQPSISITALPRQAQPNPSSNLSPSNAQASILPKPPGNMKPGQTHSGGKASFVICEICDGWIKDLDQLRNHMQWMHKVKIHPKMIYNRPPLNCQKCQFRFFTDQGLERHLLGSHGLVTSSMQDAANNGKDAGRCPVCGRMYQWKLLNHVSREHNMTLKPAHLSYKCTVCTATFGMYKQFESHVYSAHSTVAKRSNDGSASKKSIDGKSKSSSSSSPSSSINIGSGSRNNPSGMVPGAGASILKQPFKINDEITITPQPATRTNRSIEIESHVID